jgi:beta-glucanase (GH16 family)
MMFLKRDGNLYRNKRKSIDFRVDALESRLLLSAYVFDDEFNGAVGSGPSSAWGPENAQDPNNTAVYYTNTLPANATKNNPATMQIVSDSQASDGKALAMTLEPAPNGTGDYVSAEISTRVDPSGQGNNLLYGEIAARIRIPGGSNSGAIWPAFWMLGDNIKTVGWPYSGEIDIMENKGSTPGTIYSTLHGPQPGANENDYNGGAGVSSSYTLSNSQSFYSSYHIFAVNWGPNSVTFSVDGIPFYTLTPANLPSGASWAFNGHPFYIILDVNEGGSFAPGTITTPQTMDVDWVHASAYNIAAVPSLTDQDIGSPAVAGSGYFDGVTNTINGGGTGIGGTTDQFNFDYQALSGNFTLITTVDWIDDTAQYAKGGLMVRNGTAANASYSFIQLNPYGGGATGTGGLTFEYRNGAGTSAATAGTNASVDLANSPEWIELVRNGNAFSAYDSTNGTTWTQIGPSETISMNSTVDVGLAATADTSSALSTDTFTNLSILPGTFSDTNIGTPLRIGSAGYASSSSTWNIGGGGAGITSTSDQFDFAGQPLTGSGSVIADVQSMTGTASLAAAGIMFRNDTTANAAFAMLAETPSGGLVFEWRSSAGASAQTTSVSGVSAPWIELIRTGNSFSAFYSTNDVTWTQLGSAESVTIGSAALVGAAVTAGENGGQLNVATFDLLSVANAAAKLVYLAPPASTSAGDAFPSTVTVAVEDANGNIVQADHSTVTIAVSSGSATLQGTVAVTAQNGVATFTNLATSAPGTGSISVSDGTLSPANSTSITISNPPGVSPGTGATYNITGYPGSEILNVETGTVTLTTDQSANFSSLGLTIQAGASVILQADQHLSTLQLNGTATLDVNNCTVWINYGSNPDPITTIAALLNSGFNGGTWNGTGIMSSAAAANAASYGLGYADSADPGNPAGLGSGTIEIKYTLLGDANLDGVVNAIDFGILAANFNKGVTGWDQGDFNYDNIVNAIDFGDLAANFNKGAVGAQVETNATVSATAASTTQTVLQTQTAPSNSTSKTKRNSKVNTTLEGSHGTVGITPKSSSPHHNH